MIVNETWVPELTLVDSGTWMDGGVSFDARTRATEIVWVDIMVWDGELLSAVVRVTV